MKKQNILKAGLFFALAAQISWNTHQAHNNNDNMGQAVFASINKANTAAHKNTDAVFLKDEVQTASPLQIKVGSETYSIDVQVQEGINNLCASPASTGSLLTQLSSNSTERNELNCGSTTLSEYIEANADQQNKLQKDVFSKVVLKNLPEDLARNLNERINTEANCNGCEVKSVTTRIYSQSAGIDGITELRNQLAAVLSAAAEETENERKEKEKQFKKFKRLAQRMQQCEMSTPDELEDILDLTDIEDLKMSDISSSLMNEVLESDDIKKYRSGSKNKMECQKDRFTRLADGGYEEEAEEFFFKHMQADLQDYIRSNPRQAKSLIDDLVMVAGLGLDEWDAHIGLESAYSALQIMNTDVMFRDTLIDYADALRNPNISPYARQKALQGLDQLKANYRSRVDLINSNEDKDSEFYNDLTVLGRNLSDNIGVNLNTLFCDAGSLNYAVAGSYECIQLAGRKADQVYKDMASVKISDPVTGGLPTELIDLISDNRTSLIPQKYERYVYTNEGFSPSIVTDRYNFNDLMNNNSNSMTKLSDTQRNHIIRNRQRGQL